MSDQTLMFDLLAKDSVSSKFSDISRSALAASGEMRAAFAKPIDVKIETEGFDTYMAKLEAVKAMNAGAIQDIHAKSTRMLLDMAAAERELDDMAAMSDTELTRWANGGLKDAKNAAASADKSILSMRGAVGGLGVAMSAPALAGGVALLAGVAGILASAAAATAPFALAVKGVVSQFQSQKQAVEAVRSRLAGLTQGSSHYQKVLGHLHDLQHQFSAQFGPMSHGLDAVQKAWSKFIAGARPVVVQTIGMALKVVSDAIPMLLPVVKAVGPAFIQLMGDLDNFVKSAGFRQFVSWVKNTGPSSILAVGHAIGAMGAAVMAALPHLTGLMKWVEHLSGGKLAAIVYGMGALGVAIGVMGGPITATIAGIALLATGLGIAFAKVKPFHDAVMGVVNELKTKFGPILQQIGAWWHREWPTIEKLGTQVLHSLSHAIRAFVDLASALWDKFGRLILDHAKNTFEGILKVIKGVLDIVTGVVRVFTDVLEGHWSKLGGDLKTIARGAWNVIKGVFQAALGNIVDAVRSHGAQIAGWFKSLPGRILDALGNLGGLLVHAGESIISGLADGIWNATVGKLAGVLSSVTNFIKDHKGPIEVDRVLLRPAGEAIMDGLIDGIKARTGVLQNLLSGVTGMVSRAGQQLQTDLQARASFQQGFVSTYATSAFSATNAQGNPVTGAAGLIGQQRSALQQALQLRHDTRKLIGEGLSKSLLQQLAGAGPSGLEQIHALASGSLAQVHRLNRLDKQTNTALGQASHVAGADLYGSKIAADRQRKALADDFAKSLKGALKELHAKSDKAAAHQEQTVEALTKVLVKLGDRVERGAHNGVASFKDEIDGIKAAIDSLPRKQQTAHRQHSGNKRK